jgi:hypothetical protein
VKLQTGILAMLRIVGISQDAEFVSFVSRPARAAQRMPELGQQRAVPIAELAIRTIQKWPCREIAAKQAATTVPLSQNDMSSVVPVQVLGDLP